MSHLLPHAHPDPRPRPRPRTRRLAAAVTTACVVAMTAVPALAGPASAGRAFTSHMTARWMPYTDGSGTRWDARSSTLGTLRSSTVLEGKDIVGTDRDRLYDYGAVGVTGYSVSVPRQGSYRVTLRMAEGWWNAPGKRVFDVIAEDVPAASDVDIFKAVGKGAAHDVSFVVAVDDGKLDLRFVARADLALVSSIEVDEVSGPLPPQPTDGADEAAVEDPVVAQETFAHRMSASPVDVVDSRGFTWARRGPSLGSSRINTSLVNKDVAGTTDDVLYQRSVVGPKGILVPVPAPADYRVRLLLAEGYRKQAGQRVIDVRAEGATVAKDVDAVAAVGPGAAHDVVFDTRVEDGMLTVQFVDKVDQPLIAGIEVTSTDPAAAAGLPPASLIPLSESSEFRRDVSGAPTDPTSPARMARLRAAIDAGKGWNAAVNAYQYNSAFYRVTPGTPRHTVGFHDCQNKGWTPTGLFDGPAHFVDVPIPDGARAATGTDAQMGIYDPSTDTLWEFWIMRQTSSGGWEACWGGRVDDVSSSHGAFPEPFGVSASGMVMAGGVISIQEAARGEVDHALYLTTTEAKKLVFSYPANRTDGQSEGDDLLMEGQRLRLDPSLDVTKLGLTPFGEMVARTAQKYGFIVSDLAGAVAIATESGRSDERRTGLNPWDVLLGGASYDALAKFPWDRVEVLPPDHGEPST